MYGYSAVPPAPQAQESHGHHHAHSVHPNHGSRPAGMYYPDASAFVPRHNSEGPNNYTNLGAHPPPSPQYYSQWAHEMHAWPHPGHPVPTANGMAPFMSGAAAGAPYGYSTVNTSTGHPQAMDYHPVPIPAGANRYFQHPAAPGQPTHVRQQQEHAPNPLPSFNAAPNMTPPTLPQAKWMHRAHPHSSSDPFIASSPPRSRINGAQR